MLEMMPLERVLTPKSGGGITSGTGAGQGPDMADICALYDPIAVS
jgi:hypothetical protein